LAQVHETERTSPALKNKYVQYQSFIFLLKIPGPYVDMKISTRRGNCSNIKRVAGIPASKETGMTAPSLPSITILKAAQN
jgi:hypothetical protein